MAEEKQAPQPGSASNAEQSLDRILQLSAELNRIRRRQTLFNAVGVLLILVILFAFIGKVISFGKNFDTAAFTGKIAAEAPTLLEDENIVLLQKDFNSVFLPELQKQLRQKLNAKLPSIKNAVRSETQSTVKLVTVDLKDKTKKDLEKQLNEMLTRIFQKNGNQTLSKEDAEKAVSDLQTKLMAAVAEAVESDVSKAQTSLGSLNDTLQSYKTLPEYQIVLTQSADEAQTQLLESFLELWIYSIDPVRGNAPVDANGGI